VISWPDVVAWVSAVPPVVWIVAMVANMVLTAATWSTARRRVRRVGERLAASGEGAQPGRAKDTALTLASLIPAGLFWLMVLGGSLHGLVAFGHDTLGWRGGWEYLVPGTLDGVSVTFAMLAFRAVKRGKVPDRCYRVVWGAALASATINFAHEYGKSGNALAGGYVALLSLFGMFMFDEFLNQFEQGADQVRRENPKFGARWLTWPSNTFLAWVAWRNHPPAEGTPGTVANAVANLNRVRAVKREARRYARRPVSRYSGPSESGRSEPLSPAMSTALVPARPRAVRPVSARTSRASEDDVRVPATPAAVARWAQVWVAMCDRPDVALSALRDDEGVAMEHFGFRPRMLRNIRYAVATRALRRRAEELGVDLPAGYREEAGGLVPRD
jgi:hypothetical protein